MIWPMGVTEENDLYVFMAHTDVVFPDTTPLPFREDGGRFYAPGVGDDTARLAVLLHAARYFQHHAPKTGVLIVANSCEEGLGNLKGCRAIVGTFGKRIKGVITVDGNLSDLVTRAVGSHRYRVTVRTEGGHSYNDFGRKNAIVEMAALIGALYAVELPSHGDSKTTCNVGTVTGGTSVNTIAQEATMLYEYRSDDIVCLDAMRQHFLRIIDAFRAEGTDVAVELLGDRPCGAEIPGYDAYLAPILAAGREVLGVELRCTSGSTDANYPLSLGIPAVCIGGCDAHGCHTREECLHTDTLQDGLRFVMAVLGDYFG
ncbi:MAG: M20/M25/M40 family metallo-hydrolase [Clostridiales bacterium]|nr:M20/M25/M40 family metallo-hydrolase [Candidatus Cacconaster stercorequi]